MSQGLTEPVPDYPIGQPDEPEPEHEYPPATVRVLQEPRAFKDHAVTNVVVTSPNDVETVIGVDQKRRRTRVFMRNTHAADSVVIVKEKTDQAFGGFTLGPGQHLEDFSHGAFYAVLPAAGANPVTVSVLVEYEAEPPSED